MLVETVGLRSTDSVSVRVWVMYVYAISCTYLPTQVTLVGKKDSGVHAADQQEG